MSPVPTKGPRSAAEVASRCVSQGSDLILTLGGDGTVNEVMNGMVHSPVPLAVLPGGTANVLANELGLSSDAVTTAGCLSEFEPRRVSVGLLRDELGERHFLLMAGVGLDAHIVYNLDLSMKTRLGKLSYWFCGFGQVGRRLEQFDVRANGRVIRASFALASRVRNYGGDLEIAQQANLLDDLFELIVFQGENAARYLGYFAGVLTKRLANMSGVTILRTRKVEFLHASDRKVYIQIDGEYAGRPSASVEIVPGSLTLLVPRWYVKRIEESQLVDAAARLAG